MLRSLFFALGLASLALSPGGAAVDGPAIGERTRREPLRVAVAASARRALEELARRFEAASGSPVDLVVGSTGKLYAQIVHGAPFDLLFAADLDRPRRLVSEGLAEGLVVYARGRLVLWIPGRESWRGRPWDEALADPSLRRIALANPRVAPYGQAARSLLAGLDPPIAERRLVYGEDVSQTLQLVVSGAADAGFLARSQFETGPLAAAAEVWEMPVFPDGAGDSEGLLHGAVRLRRSRHPQADAFLAFCQSQEGRELLERHGFAVPVEGDPDGR